MTTFLTDRILCSCKDNEFTYVDVIEEKYIAFISWCGEIEWFTDYETTTSKEIKQHIEARSRSSQMRNMIPVESIFKMQNFTVEAANIMISYFYHTPDGTRLIGDVYPYRDSCPGGIYFKTWRGIVPPQIINEMELFYKNSCLENKI